MIDRKGNVCDLVPELNVKAVFCESLNNPSIVKCLNIVVAIYSQLMCILSYILLR